MRYSVLAAGCAALASCGTTPQPSATFLQAPYQTYTPPDAPYRLFPGDEIQVTVFSAPELNETLTVGPDGRVHMPLTGPVMAIDRTVADVRQALSAALSTQLIDPTLSVTPVSFASQQIFVGGEVSAPGLYDLPGQIDPLQAVILAGGFTDRSRVSQVVVMRRLPGGEATAAVFDLKAGISRPELAQFTPLQRFDVVYVLKTPIAQQNLLVQQYVRNALPVDFSLFYDIRGGN